MNTTATSALHASPARPDLARQSGPIFGIAFQIALSGTLHWLLAQVV
jgi:hypothetical protein